MNKIIPPQYQIDFEDVKAYYVGGGTVKNIMSTENSMIDANGLDEVSNELSITFNQLLDLEYPD